MLRSIHHRLPTGNMQFSLQYSYPHCKISFDQYSDHDHFVIFPKAEKQKEARIKKIELIMLKLNTPPSIHNKIIKNIARYYYYNHQQNTQQ